MIPDDLVLADSKLWPGMAALRERPHLLIVEDGDVQLAEFPLWNVPADEPSPGRALADRERRAAEQALHLGGTLMLMIGFDPTSHAIVSPLEYTPDRALLLIHFNGPQPANAYIAPVNIAGEFSDRPCVVALEDAASSVAEYMPGVTYVQTIAELAKEKDW